VRSKLAATYPDTDFDHCLVVVQYEPYEKRDAPVLTKALAVAAAVGLSIGLPALIFGIILSRGRRQRSNDQRRVEQTETHQMSNSDSPEYPFESRQEADPSNSASGPTNYEAVPFYRRNGFCSAIVIAHVIVVVFSGCVPLVGLVGLFTTIGVIIVCVVVLTGPVYYNKRRKDGTLKTWSRGNKVAAVILLVLLVGGYGALVYFLRVSGKLG
jgi:hypothetical protein